MLWDEWLLPLSLSLSFQGLSNLGNTCFFNAVVQCLAQVKELSYLLTDLDTCDTVLELPGYQPTFTECLGSDLDDSEGDESRQDFLVGWRCVVHCSSDVLLQ